MPTGATTGIIQVKNSDNFIATSAQALIINNIARPGLCSLSKASGTAGEQIDYNGLNFESNVNFTIALYGTPFHPIVASKSIVIFCYFISWLILGASRKLLILNQPADRRVNMLLFLVMVLAILKAIVKYCLVLLMLIMIFLKFALLQSGRINRSL